MVQVNEFWSVASKESVLARKDPAVQALLEQRRQGKEGGKGPTGEFEEWIEKALPFGIGGEEEEENGREEEEYSEEGEESEEKVVGKKEDGGIENQKESR